jgi:hypothetical protein
MIDEKTPPGWAINEALFEVLSEMVALADRTLPPGLNIRFDGDWIEVLSRGEVIGKVSHSGLLERAADIAAGPDRVN